MFSKFTGRVSTTVLTLLLAAVFGVLISTKPKVEVEIKSIRPDILHKVQVWAQKQKYLIPDEDDLHMAYTAGNQNNVDPLLILAVIGVESAFKSNAKSSAGAIGYMQIIPKWHMDKINNVHKLVDPQYNVHIGAMILREYLNRSRNNIHIALQRYNGSLGSTKYSNKVLVAYNKLKKEINNDS